MQYQNMEIKRFQHIKNQNQRRPLLPQNVKGVCGAQIVGAPFAHVGMLHLVQQGCGIEGSHQISHQKAHRNRIQHGKLLLSLSYPNSIPRICKKLVTVLKKYYKKFDKIMGEKVKKRDGSRGGGTVSLYATERGAVAQSCFMKSTNLAVQSIGFFIKRYKGECRLAICNRSEPLCLVLRTRNYQTVRENRAICRTRSERRFSVGQVTRFVCLLRDYYSTTFPQCQCFL